MGKIIVYKGKSQYNVLGYFADGLGKELKKLKETEILDLTQEDANEYVEEILGNDSLRFNMAEKAHEIVMKNHTWKNRAEQIVNML